jgi:hypothetical protein
MTVTYEWVIETVENGGDIVDHYHADKLASLEHVALTRYVEPGEHLELTLVRSEWMPMKPSESIFGTDKTLADRQWAYVKDGELPTKFNEMNGFDVPKRFLAEFAKNQTWASKLGN